MTFVLLDLVFLLLNQEIGLDESLLNRLFYVECDTGMLLSVALMFIFHEESHALIIDDQLTGYCPGYNISTFLALGNVFPEDHYNHHLMQVSLKTNKA